MASQGLSPFLDVESTLREVRPARPFREVRDLIRPLRRENPLWGAPHIHGELLNLGIDISETSVGKYMFRHRKPPSQTWRTFLHNSPQDPGFRRFLYRADNPL
jgi:hypothetical protein